MSKKPSRYLVKSTFALTALSSVVSLSHMHACARQYFISAPHAGTYSAAAGAEHMRACVRTLSITGD